MIRLVEDTIDKKDIDNLIGWLGKNPKLTKGQQTIEFEKRFANYVGKKYAVFVNSGSSANLLMAYAMKDFFPNNKIVVPAVSWSTSISPFMQAGYDLIFCDADKKNLCIDVNDLQNIIKEQQPSALLLVNVLGFLPNMGKILKICRENQIVLLEDSCETLGTTYNKTQAGSFGLISTFSFYYGHTMSTIEGGMICTDDSVFRNKLLMLRSHGWTRDLPEITQTLYQNAYDIDEFNNLYTFYEPSFNVRSTDLQAYLGIKQLEKLDYCVQKRYMNFLQYDRCIQNNYWKVNPFIGDDIISNFAYPIIHPRKNEIVQELIKNDIETRPLICGSMARQPFVRKSCFDSHHRLDKMVFANEIHDHGFYVPNHPNLKISEIDFICNIINKYTGE